jgi:hypothetical protein
MFDSTAETPLKISPALQEINKLNHANEQHQAAKAKAFAKFIDENIWHDPPNRPEQPADTDRHNGLRPLTVAGVQLVEDLPAELALAEHCSTGAAHYLIRDILLLRRRHPQTWAEVTAGRARLHHARRVAADSLDHTVEYRPGVPGQTRPSNLGPLSRRVHRAKTHAGWQLKQVEPGVFHWTSARGQTYEVGPNGTRPLNE